MDRRAAQPPPEREDRDLLDVLMSITDEDGTPTFDADVITGMFISMMFAGHHTTSGTAAWTLIELLRHPEVMAEVLEELDALAAEGLEVSYQALREMPTLEAAVKEALRLHPPLIILLRVAKVPLEVGGCTIPAGTMVAASPYVSNRLPEAFPDHDAFDPSRYLVPREEDVANPWIVDPVRGRPPPLRGRGLRHDAAQGHLLGPAAALPLRAGPALGPVPQRPLQDGRPAGPALRRPHAPEGVPVTTQDLCVLSSACRSEPRTETVGS